MSRVYIISHRGNLKGPDPKTENTVDQIVKAINLNYDVEIDLRMVKDKLFLGHDRPEHEVPLSFLESNKNYLWIHCKDLLSLSFLRSCNIDFNYFWHQEDLVTLTSKGHLWCYPGIYMNNGITVIKGNEWKDSIPKNIWGVCTDYV